MELTKHGNNAKIKVNLLSEPEMRKLGFTDYRDGFWHYGKTLMGDISFNISIPKNDASDFEIYVLYEDFCQPYDYEYLLSKTPDFAFAKKIKVLVEVEMAKLAAAGIVSGHEYGEYI